MKFLRAAILWCYIPVLIWNNTNKKILLIITILAAVFCLYCVPKKSLFTKNNLVTVTDLTAAFKTNIDKKTPNKFIVIHHTASTGNSLISEIAKVHLGERQWQKIGYHYYIDKECKIYQLLPENESCPNAYHRNFDAIAICIAGNYSTEEPTTQMFDTLAVLCKYIMQKNDIEISNIVKHCEVPDNNTECCGSKFNIDKLKKLL